jgi:hypothetical protein
VGAQWLRHLRPDRSDHAGGPRRCGLDAEMAAQWRTNEEQRLFAFLLLSRLLADGDALKSGLSVDEATTSSSPSTA